MSEILGSYEHPLDHILENYGRDVMISDLDLSDNQIGHVNSEDIEDWYMKKLENSVFNLQTVELATAWWRRRNKIIGMLGELAEEHEDLQPLYNMYELSVDDFAEEIMELNSINIIKATAGLETEMRHIEFKGLDRPDALKYERYYSYKVLYDELEYIFENDEMIMGDNLAFVRGVDEYSGQIYSIRRFDGKDYKRYRIEKDTNFNLESAEDSESPMFEIDVVHKEDGISCVISVEGSSTRELESFNALRITDSLQRK